MDNLNILALLAAFIGGSGLAALINVLAGRSSREAETAQTWQEMERTCREELRETRSDLATLTQHVQKCDDERAALTRQVTVLSAKVDILAVAKEDKAT